MRQISSPPTPAVWWCCARVNVTEEQGDCCGWAIVYSYTLLPCMCSRFANIMSASVVAPSDLTKETGRPVGSGCSKGRGGQAETRSKSRKQHRDQERGSQCKEVYFTAYATTGARPKICIQSESERFHLELCVGAMPLAALLSFLLINKEKKMMESDS